MKDRVRVWAVYFVLSLMLILASKQCTSNQGLCQVEDAMDAPGF